MAWYWSDDVARAAIDAGLVPEHAVSDWLHQPVAFAGEEGLDLVSLAGSLLGVTTPSAGAA
jgi:hypothetical protein